MKVLAIAGLFSMCLSTFAVAAPTPAVEPAVVFSALQLIVTNHVDKPDPARLLVAALDGLRQALSRASASERLVDLDASSESSARSSFVARFNQAMGSATGRLSVVQLEHAAVHAMASSLRDPFTTVLSAEQLAELRRGTFAGTGILWRRVEGGLYVWHVFSGGPAAQAGLRKFDRIVALDGQGIQGRSEDDVRKRIRGPEGSTVRITIRRPAQTTPLTLSVMRGVITPGSMAHRIVQAGIGFIHLYSLGQGASVDMTRALQDLSRQGMRALILDLRPSFGGPYDELDEVSRMLLPPGLLIYSVTGQERRTYQTTGTPLLSPTVRMVVLVGGDTESLAELLAGAISEYGRGRLVGTRTAGLGGVVRTFEMPGGGALRIKTSRVSTGKGAPIENGLRPDVEVGLSAADLDRGQDPQLERAMKLASQP